MNQEEIVDDTLLAKFLAGEATPEEAMQVIDWIEKSKENKLVFDQSQRAWSMQKEFSSGISDKGEILKLITRKNTSKKFVQFKLVTPLRIAASLLILAAAAYAVYFITKPSVSDATEEWITTNSMGVVEKFSLPEGTSIALNRNSRLTYPKEFRGGVRTVKLSGEALFDVTHNPDQPFVVSCNEINIKVLGTAFNIRNMADSATIEAHVIRGRVAMSNSRESIEIGAGWIGVYDKSAKKFTLKKADTENQMGYATHTFSFEDTSLKQITDNLGESYGVSFVFENEKLKDCHLTSSYKNKPLSFILEVISESLNLRYTVKGNIVYLSGNGCME